MPRFSVENCPDRRALLTPSPRKQRLGPPWEPVSSLPGTRTFPLTVTVSAVKRVSSFSGCVSLSGLYLPPHVRLGFLIHGQLPYVLGFHSDHLCLAQGGGGVHPLPHR